MGRGSSVVALEINKNVSLYSLHLKNVKPQYISSSIEDSEDLPVSERNNADLKELSSFV
jgi:hypothetical protein